MNYILRLAIFVTILSLFSSQILAATKPVIIIGAGVAGSKVAYELSKQNVSFVIVEATDKVGGRLRRKKIIAGGPYVEEGANWVQGYKRGEEFSDFVTNQIKLDIFETDFDDSYFYRQGKQVADEEADPVWERVEDAIADVYQFLNESYDENGNILRDLSVQSASLVAAGWKGKTPIEIQAMRFEVDYEYAVPASEISIHELTSFYDPSRESVKDMFVKDRRGFRAVVTWLLNQAGISNPDKDGSKLKLNARVSKVVYDDTGMSTSVELADGRIIEGSAIVSTVPVGVLQESMLCNPVDPFGIKFLPPLPMDKKVAISQFDLADYTKMFIKFKTPVFSNNDPTFMIPLECKEGNFLNVHNLNKPDYFPGENMVLLTSVDVLSRDLQCMNERKALKMALKYVSKAAGRKICLSEVESYIIPAWQTNPYARGSFTVRVPGITYEQYQSFNRPLGSLFFAGESHSPGYHGYVQGGYFSGLRTAGDVIRFLRNGDSSTKTPIREASTSITINRRSIPRRFTRKRSN